MSQPPENPAQEAQELATTPTVEPRQESTLSRQAQETLKAMETPSQNREDESKLYYTQLQQSLDDAEEFLSSGNPFLDAPFPGFPLNIVAPPRPSSSTTVKDSLTSRGTPGNESSPARHSEEGVTGKKSDGDGEEDNGANEGNGEGVEDNEEDKKDDEEDDEEDHPSPELTPILPRVPTPGVTYTRPHKTGGVKFPKKYYDNPLPCTTPAEGERRRVSLGASRLSDKVQKAMRALKHKVDIPTVYPTMSDLWSVEEWNTNGPQCWDTAPDLCIWFAQLGNRYQQPSSFQVMMLSTMPFLRLPEFTIIFHQLEGEGHFNWMRNDNIDSLLAYMCGKVVKKGSECQRCTNHTGMMEKCVVIEGYMRNACSNCWKNSKQASCVHYEEPSKESKTPTKHAHTADNVVVDLATDTTPQSSEPARKKRKTGTAVTPSTPASARRNTKDWGTPQNIVNPDFQPNFEPLHPPPKKTAVTRKAAPKTKSRKGKEKAQTPPREPTPPVRSLDELRQAGLIEDEEKLRSLMDTYNIKPVEEIRTEKDNFKAIFCEAAAERQRRVADVEEAERTLRDARETLQAAESQMVNAEKCVALLNQVKGATQAKLTLGGF